MPSDIDHLHQPILTVARKDVATLDQTLTIRQALDAIRSQGVGEKIVYFYVVDEENRLVGVLPTRRLLTSNLDARLSDVMITRVVAISSNMNVLEACEMFVMHRFLAFPVIDEEKKILGVVDIDLLTEEAFDIAEREQMDTVFETFGFTITQIRDASPLKAFRFRFPWLLATITSGTICALLTSQFEATLAQSIILAFFLTLVLGLGESVSVQSMTVTIQALRSIQPTLKWYLKAFGREFLSAALLGVGSGASVGMIVLLWFGNALSGFSIGFSIFLSITAAAIFGLSVPTVLHALRLDPKVAAGPVTLALTDISTIFFYFSVATALL